MCLLLQLNSCSSVAQGRASIWDQGHRAPARNSEPLQLRDYDVDHPPVPLCTGACTAGRCRRCDASPAPEVVSIPLLCWRRRAGSPCLAPMSRDADPWCTPVSPRHSSSCRRQGGGTKEDWRERTERWRLKWNGPWLESGHADAIHVGRKQPTPRYCGQEERRHPSPDGSRTCLLWRGTGDLLTGRRIRADEWVAAPSRPMDAIPS